MTPKELNAKNRDKWKRHDAKPHRDNTFTYRDLSDAELQRQLDQQLEGARNRADPAKAEQAAQVARELMYEQRRRKSSGGGGGGGGGPWGWQPWWK